MSQKLSRRQYAAGTGSVLTLGVLAGCADDDAEPDANGGAGGDDGDDDGNGTNGDENGGDVPSEIDEYLADARLYEGSLEDHTGEDEVEVLVGGGPDGLAFDPPAIRIDAGTTVRWEWTGEGGQHNVESDEESASDFSSGDAVDDPDETFEQSFDDDGIQLYACTPHIGVGMLGAIDVVDE